MSARNGEAPDSGNEIRNVFILCRVPAGACSAHASYGQSRNAALLMGASECAAAWISAIPSELAPGQAAHSPAAQRAAVVLRVQFTLKALEYVAHVGEAVLLKLLSRIG
jgi:hypothetical protein